ncbi:MAG: mechanosensitive ion channel family protein [Spirochaetota bacterium]
MSIVEDVWQILEPHLLAIAILTASAVAGFVVANITNAVLRKASAGNKTDFFHTIVHRIRGPIRLFVPLVGLIVALPLASLPDPTRTFADHAFKILMILDVSWFAIRIIAAGEAYLLMQYPVTVEDNLKARKVHTQIRIIRRVVTVVLAILGISAVLISFEPVRQLGTTILASAGVVGIVIGIAAQRTLGLIIAGLQVALAQPIRIDDVVVVENEWGRIEEITLTYVVVKIWDQRRLVIPITFFIEQPFQNWTRRSAELLGTVYLYTDYTVPVPELREELRRLLSESPYWDGKVSVLQVTGATERAVELRALMSAGSSPVLWDLRCEIREKLLDYLQREHPEALPRTRATLLPDSPEENG